jgi:hypothetical protein
MQEYSPEFYESLERRVELRLKARVVAEWEVNSYYDYSFSISETVDEDLFSSEDILKPRRPKSGLPKLYSGAGKITSPEQPIRYRVASEDSRYKYYSSREVSDENSNINFEAQVLYGKKASMNRLVVGFESAYSSPEFVLISFMYQEGIWSDPLFFSPDQNGQVVINRSSRRWSQDDIIPNEYIGIYGVKVEVLKLDGPNKRLDLIQISSRLVFDFSDRVISASVSKSREETSLATPLGRSQSSTANIRISNDDRFFNPEDESSVLYGLIDKNVRFDIWFGLNTFEIFDREEEPNFEYIKQITMFSDEWSFDSDSTISVGGRDRSKFFQEEMIENSFYTDKTAQEIIRDIVERSGVVDWDIRYTQEDGEIRVPFVFFKDNKTVWESLEALAIAEQAAFYFDENDIFVWESRDYLWSDETPDIQIRSQPENGLLANLVNFSFDYELGANKIDVSWTPTGLAQSRGEIVNNVLWEQQDPVVLGATILQDDITINDKFFLIDSRDEPFFPKEGIVNVNGEYISYKKYEDDAPGVDQEDYENPVSPLKIEERGLFNSTIEEHLARPSSSEWSFYTLDYSESPSRKEGNNLLARHFIRGSKLNIIMPEQNFRRVSHYEGGAVDDSYAVYGCQLRFPLTVTAEQLPDYEGDGAAGLFIHKTGDTTGYYFEIITSPFAFRSEISEREARIWKFDENGNPEIVLGYVPEITDLLSEEDFFRVAGSNIVIAPGQNYELTVVVNPIPLFAYLEEELRTKSFIREWKERSPDNQQANQEHLDAFFAFIEQWEQFVPETVEEWEEHNQTLQDFFDEWENSTPDPNQAFEDYTAELDDFLAASDDRIQESLGKDFSEMRFYVDGQQVLSLIDSDFQEGNWGVFSRSKTSVEFEYVYAIDRRGVVTDIPSSALKIRDYIRGGFRSDALSSFLTQYNQLRSDVIIEDFGPWVQEMKEFDVDHEISPSISSNLFLSAEADVEKVYHYRDQFSSRFGIVNKTRAFIVVVGTDPRTGSSMKMFTYGVPVVQRESNRYMEEDRRSIWRRGVEEISIESMFIQSEDQAKRIAEWAALRWGTPSDTITVSTIVNPAAQPGDLVALDIPEENISRETHLYFINSIESSVGSTTEMTMALRRAYF